MGMGRVCDCAFIKRRATKAGYEIVIEGEFAENSRKMVAFRIWRVK